MCSFVSLQCKCGELSKISRSTETLEMLECRPVDIFCVQKTRFKGKSARITSGKATEHKLFWIRNDQHFGQEMGR